VVRVIVLDAGPLGLISSPKYSKESSACFHWTQSAVAAGVRVIIPEIADYEVRRELIRARKKRGLAHLDRLAGLLEYQPITTAIMRKAAELWAIARQTGRPTSGDQRIDADVILAAHALSINVPETIVATTNVGHLSRFTAAERWQSIQITP
jgi:predicted nucleic acid-binding protein